MYVCRSKASYRDIFSESHTTTKSQHRNKQVLCSKNKSPSRNELFQHLDTLKRSCSIDDTHQKPPKSSQNQDSFISGNIAKTPLKAGSTSRLSEDKTSAGYLHTPKQHRMCMTPRNTKMNSLSTSKTPIKRYFSDHNLSQATPDCFSKVQLDTPSIKANDVGIDDAIIYDGENSNLTVGIRVRPLNMK